MHASAVFGAYEGWPFVRTAFSQRKFQEKSMLTFFVLLVDLFAGKLAGNHNQSRLVG